MAAKHLVTHGLGTGIASWLVTHGLGALVQLRGDVEISDRPAFVCAVSDAPAFRVEVSDE